MIDRSDAKLGRLKRAARNWLPNAVYRRSAALWRLRGELGWTFKTALQSGRPRILLHFGIAPGDDLLCTVVLREVARRNGRDIWMMSNHPELFDGNEDVDQVVPVDPRFEDYATLFGGNFQSVTYAEVDCERDASVSPERHIIAELCLCAGVRGQISLRPYFYLTATEKGRDAWAQGMIAIQSSGLAAKWPMRNKQWFPERFQEVINLLILRFKFVQLGSVDDPPLSNVTDLRGKTNIRETAAVLANCTIFIGNVGFLMHLARAVDCRSVIVYGGREAPWQSGYSCNTNLYSALPCAPCWLWNRCDYGRACMENISARDVVDAIEIALSRTQTTLPVDSFTI